MYNRPQPERPAPGQESVWDYPRPPLLEPTPKRIRIEHRGVVIAETTRALRLLETSHPPTYYLPPDDLCTDLLRLTSKTSGCEWKGRAVYFDLVMPDGEVVPEVAWAYPSPTARFAALEDHLAFYAAPLDGCFVDGERVTPQPGGFYGGWVTSDLAGPFKGIPGSWGW
ncbi:MAG: DUF427 domain-containing protein [Bacteroidota bacterium]